MTYHTCALLTTVSSRDHGSIREVMTVHTTVYNTHKHTLYSVSAVQRTHTYTPLQWIEETHLDKLDSRYWVEEQMGIYMGCYTAPSHSERAPPGKGENDINKDEGDWKDGVLNCQSVSDPPNSSRHHRDSLPASTWLCGHTGHQNRYSL